MTDLAVTDTCSSKRTGMDPVRSRRRQSVAVREWMTVKCTSTTDNGRSIARDDAASRARASHDAGSVCVRCRRSGPARRMLPNCGGGDPPRGGNRARACSEAVTRACWARRPRVQPGASIRTEPPRIGGIWGLETRLLARIERMRAARPPVEAVMASLSGVWQAVAVIARTATASPIIRAGLRLFEVAMS